jgi:transcriptional regulator with XRE-family HTH domain
MKRELILKHWKPIRLRALRISKGFTNKEIAARAGLSSTQINSWELGTKFANYANKQVIYKAYDITAEELEPQEQQVDRICALMNEFSREEIQMAYDLQVAEERCNRFDASRARASFNERLNYKKLCN